MYSRLVGGKHRSRSCCKICLPACFTNLLGVQAPNDMAHSQSIGHEALRQYADYHLDHLGPYFPSVAGKPAVIPEAKSFKEFVNELKRVLDRQQLPERAFDWIFSPHQILNKPRPNCGGAQI